MTLEEAREQVEEAKRKAHAAAQKLTPGTRWMTSMIVNPARLEVLEGMLAALMAERSTYPGSLDVRTACELRDYWEAVAEEIAS